ncbi:MAG: hypothetical protein H7839_11250 [Magnetococcus sp. YQC-5]
MKIFQSVSHTILIGLLLFGLVLISTSYLFSLETRKIHQQAMADHSFLSLLNTVLEVRRFEKNYFIYHEKNYLENVLNYLDQAELQLRRFRTAFLARPDGEKMLKEISVVLTEYREKFLYYTTLPPQDAKQSQEVELSLHLLGKKLITQAENLAADTEDNISAILQNTLNAILISNIGFIITLIFLGIFFVRKTVHPLSCIQDGLTNIMAGRQKQLATPCLEQEFVALTRMINMTLNHLMHNKEERSRRAQQAFTDAMLLRLVKTLGQPMANISTASQILMEDDLQTLSTLQQEMLMQIRQQAEQGRRLLTAVQEYATPTEEPTRQIHLAQMIHQIVETLQADLVMEIPDDLIVIGNPYTLERGLNDLITLSVQSTPGANRIPIKGCRRQQDEMREVMKCSSLRPLVWLPVECNAVTEISLPIAGEMLSTDSDQLIQDVSSLCVLQEDGTPGISLLPVIIRHHGGALLAEVVDDSIFLFRLWLPDVSTGMHGMEQSAKTFHCDG